MTIKLETSSTGIRIIDAQGEIPSATKSSLRLKGFNRISSSVHIANNSDAGETLQSAFELLKRAGVDVTLDAGGREVLYKMRQAQEQLTTSLKLGRDIRNGSIDNLDLISEFLDFAENGLARPLLKHQIKAAIHLFALANSANFSVPGAGKTAVVLAVFEYLRITGGLTSLFVVGPRSCFMPWQTEFELTLGRRPSVTILAGGDVQQRRQSYYPSRGNLSELYLTTYHTLARDTDQVIHLLQSSENLAFYIIDEAHYMKQEDGVWANAIITTSKVAKKRCVLTGTPFPKTYADGVNQFEVLYPHSGIFSPATRSKIRVASDSGDHGTARSLLEPTIDGLYYRVRKSDLSLSKPMFEPPILVKMNPIERELYDCINLKISELEDDTVDSDFETIVRLRQGRLIRKRQATSYARLLLSAIDGYDEMLIDPENAKLSGYLSRYDALEKPAKLERLLYEVSQMKRHRYKVVIWANFVGTLFKIEKSLRQDGYTCRVVYGGTPTEVGMEEENREDIIEMFKDPSSGLDILIANPAACAESISLHKTCHNAIYYDLSYNCAEYLQSLDRIHRVGGSEHRAPHYRFLQYQDTFEHEILSNLLEKAQRMADVIDQDFPLAYSELGDMGLNYGFEST